MFNSIISSHFRVDKSFQAPFFPLILLFQHWSLGCMQPDHKVQGLYLLPITMPNVAAGLRHDLYYIFNSCVSH